MKISKLSRKMAWVTTLAILICSPVHADDWLRLESKNAIVFSNAGEKDARAYINSLEAFNSLAHAYYRKLAPSEVSGGKFVSYYFKRVGDFQSFEANFDRFRIYTSCRDGYSALWTSDKDMNGNYGQLYQFVGLNNRISGFYDMREMPKWMSVGLHAFLASAEVKDNAITVGHPAQGQYEAMNPRNGQIISLTVKNDRVPFAEVLSGKYAKPEKAVLAPAQSWVIMHYMLTSSPENAGKLYKFTDDYHFGLDAQKSWDKNVGIDPTVFDDVVTRYKTSGVPVLTYKIADVGEEVSVTPLARMDDDIPLLSVAAQTCPEAKDKARILLQMARAAEKLPDDTYITRENARAQILLGEGERALPYVTAGLAATPNDADLNYLAGRIYLARAEADQDSSRNFAQARSYFGKSYKLRSEYAPTLHYYARAFADQPDYPSENTLVSAEAADALMNTMDYGLYLAELYARREMYDDMSRILDRHRTIEGGTLYDVTADKIVKAAKARNRSEILALFAGIPETDRFRKTKS